MSESLRQYLANNFKNTELGLVRIARNLALDGMSNDEIINHCRHIILATQLENIEQRGKNYYLSCAEYGAILTINKSSNGIITAKPCKQSN